MSSETWTIVSAVAAIISALAVAVSLLLVLLQLRRMRLAQETDTAVALYEKSTGPEMLEAIDWIKNIMPASFSYENFKADADARRRIQRVLYHFEFVGVLVHRGYMSPEIVFDQEGSLITGMWEKVTQVIQARRAERKDLRYMENFELLCVVYAEWARRQKPKVAPPPRDPGGLLRR